MAEPITREPTTTDLIQQALAREVESWRETIDSKALHSIRLLVLLDAELGTVREIITTPETRSSPHRRRLRG